MELPDFSLQELLRIEASVAGLIVRGTLLYIGILLIFRFLPRRTGGELATMDLVFVLLISEAATHSLGEYSSVTEGFIVICTLVFWDYMINALSFRFSAIERLFSAPPLLLIKNGKLNLRHMRREFITHEELMESLRKEGFEDIKQVKKAVVEADGKISIIKNG